MRAEMWTVRSPEGRRALWKEGQEEGRKVGAKACAVPVGEAWYTWWGPRRKVTGR